MRTTKYDEYISHPVRASITMAIIKAIIKNIVTLFPSPATPPSVP